MFKTQVDPPQEPPCSCKGVVSLQNCDYFDVISIVDESVDHGQLLSICFFYNNVDV